MHRLPRPVKGLGLAA